MPREQVHTILEAYFSWYKAIPCDFFFLMQSSFDNGKPNLRRVGKNHYGKIFSKISKEMKFKSSW